MSTLRKGGSAAVLIALLACASAPAQEYGQWSWNATLGGGYRSWRNGLNGATRSDFSQRDLRLFAGIEGFLLHPSIAAFALGLETADSSSRSAVDSTRFGYRAHLSILPEGWFPVQLYAARQSYGYERAEAPEALFFSIPERGTSYGGRIRVRGGILRGFEAALDRSSVDLAGRSGENVADREMIAWSRGSARLRQNYRLERQERSYARGAYRLEDLIARGEEQATFGRWRWNAFGNLVRRDYASDSGESPGITSGRLTSILTNETGGRPAWTYLVESEYTDAAESELRSHRLEARHIRPRTHGVQWSASASWALQSAGAMRVQAPALSVGANWIASVRALDLAASASAGVLRLIPAGPASLPEQTSVSYSGGFSLDHRSGERLRESLEGSLSRNRLRTSFLVEGQPAFGSIGSPGTEDAAQMRLTLTGRIARSTVSAFSDWSEQESTISLGATSFEVETLMHTLQLISSRATMTATRGATDVRDGTAQAIEFAGATLSVAPFSSVSVSTSYREDRRSALFEPRIDGARFEAGASIRLGAIWLNPLVFRTREQFEGGDERTYDGVTLSLSRRMGGYLPVVTAPKRRGTIR